MSIFTLVLKGPQSPADRRPNDEPFYAEKHCETCGEKLIYAFSLETPEITEDEIWNDEFVCPKCSDVLVMDWPPELIKTSIDKPYGKTISLEDALREIGNESG